MSDVEEPLFLPASFFLVRTPLLPVEEFHKQLTSNNIPEALLESFKNSPELKEAIAVASFSLFQTLCRLSQGQDIGQKEKEQAIAGLFKYVSRMCTRATPFGLFSSVALGYFDENSCAFVDVEKTTKRARPDMEWLIKAIDQFTTANLKGLNLSLKKNPLLQTSMGRGILPYSRKKKESTSIRANILVNLILEKTSDQITYSDLINTILNTLPQAEEEKVAEVIGFLINEDILYPTLAPTLLSSSPFKDLLSKMGKNVDPFLKNLDLQISKYNATKPGEGLELFEKIREDMESQFSASTPLQVDSVTPAKVHLPQAVSTELSRVAETLWKLFSTKRGMPFLRTYHSKFLEKYGVFRTVPLLELLDENIGLGAPEYYIHRKFEKVEKEKREKAWEEWLEEEKTRCLIEKREEILITDEIVKRFAKDKDKIEAPSSFDLYTEIFAPSLTAIGEGEFLASIQPVSGAGDGCSTFGRFLDLFKEDELENVRQFLKEEEALEPAARFFECSYFPSSARSANVATHTSLRKQNVDLGYAQKTDASLRLEDIYVGATQERLFLTLKDGSVELCGTALNVLNPEGAPIPLRLLRDISKERYGIFSPFYWGDLENSSFLPRLKYSKTIISPARWRLTLSLIGASSNETLDSLMEKISAWATKWRVPQLVFMTIADNRLLLDWTIPLHLREVAQKLKTAENSTIYLIEKIGEDKWVQSTRGSHRSEFVFPVIKNKKYRPNGIMPLVHASISSTNRWKLPGSEWFYAKIYLKNEEEMRFLITHLPSFLHASEGQFTNWFFIRYSDHAPHVRLRFKLKNSDDFAQFLKQFHLWIDPLVHSGHIKEVAVLGYEREIERYGGASVIEKAEAFFHADAETALALLDMIVSKKTDLPSYMLVAMSLINILQEFGLSLHDQIQFFSKMEIDKNHLKGFREQKGKILPIAQDLLALEERCSSDISRQIQEALYPRKSSLSIYVEGLKKVENLNSDGVILSLLHMNCNRILGTDSSLEQKALLHAAHILNVIKAIDTKG